MGWRTPTGYPRIIAPALRTLKRVSSMKIWNRIASLTQGGAGAPLGGIPVRGVRRSGSRPLLGRWVVAIAAGIFIAASVWLTLLVRNWPFTEHAVAQALADRFARPVEIRSFRRTYFPPG